MAKRKLTSKEFNTIKQYQELGLNQTQSRNLSGRSSSTCSRVYRSDTYEDYLGMAYANEAQESASQDPNLQTQLDTIYKALIVTLKKLEEIEKAIITKI